MVPVGVGVTKGKGQTVQYLDCPECGHQLKEPAGASSTPPAGRADRLKAGAPAIRAEFRFA
jgi:hypothetical protein